MFTVTEKLWIDPTGTKILKTPEPDSLVFALPGMILPDETARLLGLIPVGTKVVYPEETKVIWPPETKRRRGRPRKM